MFNRRRNNRSGAASAIEIKRMTSLVNAPAVIFTAPDQMSRLPQILSVISHPDLSSARVNRHAPRISQTVSPNFRARIGAPNKRIIRRHRVGIGSVGMIDVDSQNASEQGADVLSGIPTIRITGAIAG